MSDLLELVSLAVPVRKAANTRGGEFAGPCPFCGEGHDRFRVWPNADPPRWWCRRCDRGGDAIQYLIESGVSYRAACAQLGIATRSGRPFGGGIGISNRPENSSPVAAAPRREPGSAPAEPPSPTWRARASEFVAQCERRLWSAGGANVRAYLHARGLTDATIRRARLGYHAARVDDAPAVWGIDPWVERSGRPARVRLSRGLVVPCVVGGTVWYVKTRRPLPGDGLDEAIGGGREGPKYVLVKGSQPALYGADAIRPGGAVVWTEGELDALLVGQEAGDDLVAAVTMGSASTRPSGIWLVDLAAARVVLRLADGDDAGIAAAERDAALSPRIRVVRLPAGYKDAGEYRQAGGSLRAFVAHHLERLARDPAADELADAHAAYRRARAAWSALLFRQTAAIEAGDELEAARLKREADAHDRGTVAPARDRCWALEDQQQKPAA
jgi:DNA primase